MAEVGIFVGTVYGNALLVAEEAQSILSTLGHQVKVFEDPTFTDWRRYASHYALIVTSTTGQGDLPDSIAPLYRALKETGFQPELKYSVIALGDSSYSHFCGAGLQFDALLQEMGALRIDAPLLVDATETPEPETVTNGWVKQWATLIK